MQKHSRQRAAQALTYIIQSKEPMLHATTAHRIAADAPENFIAATGRVLLALLFVYSGIGKVLDFPGFASYLESLGVPAAWVLAAGAAVIEIVGALCLISGWRMEAVCWMRC